MSTTTPVPTRLPILPTPGLTAARFARLRFMSADAGAAGTPGVAEQPAATPPPSQPAEPGGTASVAALDMAERRARVRAEALEKRARNGQAIADAIKATKEREAATAAAQPARDPATRPTSIRDAVAAAIEKPRQQPTTPPPSASTPAAPEPQAPAQPVHGCCGAPTDGEHYIECETRVY